MMHQNKTGREIDCDECDEPIADGEYFHVEDGENLCECCHEDRHEYDYE